MVNFYVDSNIWAWYFNKKSKHHQKVKQILTSLLLDETHTFFVNYYTIVETFHYFFKFLGPQKGEEVAIKFLSADFLEILPISKDDTYFINVLSFLKQYSSKSTIGGRDATILVSMLENSIEKIVTHDKGFQVVKEVKVIDPLAINGNEL